MDRDVIAKRIELLAHDRWLDLYGLGPASAVLVRPDGHVGWRSAIGAPSREAALDADLRRILAR